MTADLTKIDKPFGELDDATKGALLLAHHNDAVIEFFTSTGKWQECTPAFADEFAYRVRPAPAVMGIVTLYGIDKPSFPICDYVGCSQGPHVNSLTFTFPTRDGHHVPGVYTSPDGLHIVIEVLV